MGLAYIILRPIFTKISASFMSEKDLLDHSIRWIPQNATLLNYRIVLNDLGYFRALINTFLLAGLVSLMQLISSTMVGYGLGRFEFRCNKLIFALVIFTMVVPPYMMMIPVYLNFRFFDILGILPNGGINLLNSYWPFILTSLTGTGLRNGLFIFVMRQFFKGLPKNLEEAAYVDGAGFFKTFYKIMLPGAVPALVIVFLFSFVWMWSNDYQIGLYLANSESFLPTLLAGFEDVAGYLDSRLYSLVANAAMLLFIAPLLVIYMFMQRYFIESIERTGIVG
ncbi:MAG: carbohydrate ABC transporter permease [bacterium]